MTPREVLLKAAALVERGWTQDAGARSAKGNHVRSTGRAAVCWCAEGAIQKAAFGGDGYAYHFAKGALLRALPKRALSIPDWNDAPGRTQAEVVAALKAAAETCA